MRKLDSVDVDKLEASDLVIYKKLDRNEVRRQTVLGNLRATEGWEFRSYVRFEGGFGTCGATGGRLKNGVKIFNPYVGAKGLELIVGMGVLLKYTNLRKRDLPRRTAKLTEVVDVSDRRVVDVWPSVAKPLSSDELEQVVVLEDRGSEFHYLDESDITLKE